MTDFTITSMNIIDREPAISGARVLATFSIAISGIRMIGCVLVEGADGIVSAKGIRGRASKGDKISAQFVDAALQRAVSRRVAETYTLLTGREVSHE